MIVDRALHRDGRRAGDELTLEEARDAKQDARNFVSLGLHDRGTGSSTRSRVSSTSTSSRSRTS